MYDRTDRNPTPVRYRVEYQIRFPTLRQRQQSVIFDIYLPPRRCVVWTYKVLCVVTYRHEVDRGYVRTMNTVKIGQQTPTCDLSIGIFRPPFS